MIKLKFWEKTNEAKIYWKIIGALAVVAIFVSAYLLKIDLTVDANTSQVCDFSDKFSCTTVAMSKYSRLFGIPVAAYGIVAYSLMFITSIYFVVAKEINKKVWATWLTFLFGSLGFSLYLTYLELFVIGSICIFCVIQQIIILIIFGLHWPIVKNDKRL